MKAFHYRRLVAALSKYWRPVTEREYLHEMDIPQTEAACRYAGFPEEVIKDIWEPELRPGFHITKEVRRVK